MPSQSAICPLWQWHQKLLRWPVSLLPAVQDSSWDRPRCPLRWSTLTACGYEQGHWVTTYNQGIHRYPLQKAGIWLWNCLPSNKAQTAKAIKEVRDNWTTMFLRHWGYVCSSYQGGGVQLHRAHQHLTAITWGTYAGNGEGSHWGGREGLPVFSNCLQSGTAGLSPQKHMGYSCTLHNY